MRKPHLCHVFPAFATGGPEVRTSLLINALSNEFRHTIISLNGDLSGQARLHRQGDVGLVPAPHFGSRFRKPFLLARLIRNQAPDLVLTYGWWGTDGVMAARMCGIRRVIHAEDGFLPEEAKHQRLTRILARRILLRMPAVVVCPSRTLVEIATGLWQLPPPKIRYLPNGVDSQRFVIPSRKAVTQARERFGLKGEDIVIGTVGHLRAEKNQARLIHSFATIPLHLPTKLLIVGDGPLRETLEKQAKTLGLKDRVIFAGLANDPLAAYQAMDIFALSSDTEQMPIALLEAMGMGLPLLSTDVGDVRTMVSPENRPWVVPAHDGTAYAAALARLVENREERLSLGQANRGKCQIEFDVSAMIETYKRLYWEILAKSLAFSRSTVCHGQRERRLADLPLPVG